MRSIPQLYREAYSKIKLVNNYKCNIVYMTNN